MTNIEILTLKNIQNYLSTLTELVCELHENPELESLETTKNWMTKVIFYNVPHSENLHGLATTVAFKHLIPESTESDLKDSYVIGWCFQMFVTCFWIMDDINNESTERHFKSCWHLVDNIGNEAYNDVVMMVSSVYYLLKKYFGNKEFYAELLQLFHDLANNLALSKTIDCNLSNDTSLESFDMETYSRILRYKSSCFPSYFHVRIAMLFASITDDNELKDVKYICSKIDFQFQIRKDYCDIYGDNQSHDVETGNYLVKKKCCWFISKALELSTPQQRILLKENYGKSDSFCVETVKYIYEEIGIKAEFEKYESQKHVEILNDIEKLSSNVPKALFKDMMWASFPKQMSALNQIQSSDLSVKSMKKLTKDIFDFLGTFPEIIEDLMVDPDTRSEVEELTSIITRLMVYNVPHGKKARGLLVKSVFKALGHNMTSDVVKKLHIIGWCLEMLQAAALMADDVMDKSLMRRGMPCWYKLEDVALFAFNDACLLLSSLYRLLKMHFENEEYYVGILELFQGITFKTSIGQSLDIHFGIEMNLDKFTMENYSTIVKYKTSYYTFYLPVALPLVMAGPETSFLLDDLTPFLLDIGHYFQVQDDYMDCFGDYEAIGKIGTDIADGKCSWLIVSAIELASPNQIDFIKEHYGKGLENPESIDKIKELYKEMKLPEKFEKYENETYEILQNTIKQIPFSNPDQEKLFSNILKSTFKRKK